MMRLPVFTYRTPRNAAEVVQILGTEGPQQGDSRQKPTDKMTAPHKIKPKVR